MRVPSTKKLLAFQLAARSGSFKSAAQLLYLTPSAVSARVQSLERELGIRLFERGIRRLTLTEAGRVYAQELESIFASLGSVTRAIKVRFRQPVTGKLRASLGGRAIAVAAAFEHGNVPGHELL